MAGAASCRCRWACCSSRCPSARRFYKLGQALRRAIESYPEDLRVAIVATGGLSHQVHGERAGFNNPEWDQRFLDLFEHDPEQLADDDHRRVRRRSAASRAPKSSCG